MAEIEVKDLVPDQLGDKLIDQEIIKLIYDNKQIPSITFDAERFLDLFVPTVSLGPGVLTIQIGKNEIKYEKKQDFTFTEYNKEVVDGVPV